MIAKRLCLLCMVVLLAACGGKSRKAEPPPKPTRVVLEIEAFKDINPDFQGHFAPLVLRIYELKAAGDFNGADFISLYEKDKSVLGGDLVRKQEMVLQPNDKKSLTITASADTTAIGVFAVFRNYEKGRWRLTLPVRPQQTVVVPIAIRGNNLNSQ